MAINLNGVPQLNNISIVRTHQLGKDYGITPIKLENKYSTKEMDEILKDINDVLYFFSYLFIGKSAREYILNKLEDAGKKLNNYSPPIPKAQRKKELLEKLRELYRNVKKILPYDSPNFNNLELKMSGFLVAKFVKQKQQGLTVDDKLYWLKTINTFSQVYTPSESLISVNNELLNYFKI